MNKVLRALQKCFVLPRAVCEGFPEMTFELSFRKWLRVHYVFTGSKENEHIPVIGNSKCRVAEPRKSLAHVGNCRYFRLVGMPGMWWVTEEAGEVSRGQTLEGRIYQAKELDFILEIGKMCIIQSVCKATCYGS